MAFLILPCVITIGTVGYHILTEWKWIDSFTMAMSNMGTMGMVADEWSVKVKVFSVLLFMMGILMFSYITSCFVGLIMYLSSRNWLVSAMTKKLIDGMKDHVIVCGYSKIGSVVALKLHRKLHGRVVVIDNNPDVEYLVSDKGVLFINGDACDKHVLEDAGIKSAKYLITALPKNCENVFVIIMAKKLSDNLTIISRMIGDDGGHVMEVMKDAGASYVVSPYEAGADKIVDLIV